MDLILIVYFIFFNCLKSCIINIMLCSIQCVTDRELIFSVWVAQSDDDDDDDDDDDNDNDDDNDDDNYDHDHENYDNDNSRVVWNTVVTHFLLNLGFSNIFFFKGRRTLCQTLKAVK